VVVFPINFIGPVQNFASLIDIVFGEKELFGPVMDDVLFMVFTHMPPETRAHRSG